MEPAKVFPIYQLQDAFEAFCHGEPLVKPQHRSLYYFLLGYCRRRGNTPRFSLAFEAGMHGSAIGSWATYDTAMKALAEWGFIVYTPGANRYKVPVVELTFRNPTDDVLLTYWQSYCLSTGNPTDDVIVTQVVTLKEDLKKEDRKDGSAQAQGQPASQLSSASQVGNSGAGKEPCKFPADEAKVFATFANFSALVTQQNFGQIDKGFYLPEIQRKAGLTKQVRDEVGWENFVLDFLKRELRDQKLVLADPNAKPVHVPAPFPVNPRTLWGFDS